MAIVAGQLRPGQRLPSTRILAADLQISRFSVLSAFGHLLEEGYLNGRVGSGTYVADVIPDDLAKPIRVRNPSSRLIDEPSGPASMMHGSARADALGTFTVSLPALNRVPNDVFSHLIRRHATDVPVEFLAYGDPAGYLPLREAIADYLRTARAVDCVASQVIIVSGSQMGLFITAMALTAADSSVCVEEPGYRGTKRALAASRAQIIAVAVDGEGMNVAALAALGRSVSMVCVTPSHQYPLGMSMELSRRLELLSWAAQNEAWILEDDYDSEFRYSSRPLGALQGMDTKGRVIYLGTFSKVLFPALRVGYLVVPSSLVESFVEIRESLDLFPPILNQLILTDFLREGHFARHLRRMKAIYRSRRDALIRAIEQHAADVLAVGHADAGLHLVASLPEGVHDTEVVRRAARHGLFPQALSACYVTGAARSGLILGFGGSNERQLTTGVIELSKVIRDLM
jgi:GntR family transcriptional regulator/MocR family aminotransferase